MQHITSIAICGAGTMGTGIAQTAAQSGFNTVMYDLSEQMLEKSKSAITAGLQKLVEKGNLTTTEKTKTERHLLFTNNISGCKADLIIEAVAENKEVKTKLFNQLAQLNAADIILATNTSSLSISAIAADVLNSTRVIGMHFFNPAPVMKLVEVIRGTNTDESVVQTVYELAKQMNKIPVICNDSPGFIVNRVARPYYLEALKMLEKGIADLQTIDKAMENAGFKMGPFKLMDLIGLDVNYTVSDSVWRQLDKPERLKPSTLQQQKLQKGELGKKSGKGFYDY